MEDKKPVSEMTDLELFDLVVSEMRDVFIERNRWYKRSFQHMDSISFSDTIIAKGARAKEIRMGQIQGDEDLPTNPDECIKDSFLDAANYGILGMINMKRQGLI